jgi:hypothetical protein
MRERLQVAWYRRNFLVLFVPKICLHYPGDSESFKYHLFVILLDAPTLRGFLNLVLLATISYNELFTETHMSFRRREFVRVCESILTNPTGLEC